MKFDHNGVAEGAEFNATVVFGCMLMAAILLILS